ncbi:MAG: PEP-CTERM sorting domain-containing protein [Microcystaceae cyanobacterium]
MNHKLTHTLLLTSLVTFTGAVFQPQNAQAAGLIVVDFDVNGGTTGTNWNQITPDVSSIANLIDIDGVSTGASFGATVGSPLGYELGDPISSQVPTDSPITTTIGGNVFGDSQVSYWFTNLEPGALYKIYVFSYRDSQYFNQITVETQETIPTYDVTGNQQLFVNQELGTDSRTLDSYTDIVSVWEDGPNIGGIGVTIDVNTEGDPFFGDRWALAGIAIEEIPIPEPSGLLGLGLIGGGMILRTLIKKVKRQ